MPTLLAHRGLPGRWQNSRRGVQTALAAGYDGVEIDLVLTRDGALLLSHDPWLHPELVQTRQGAPLGEQPILVRDLTLPQLQGGFRFACAHPEHPGAEGAPEGPCTLTDVIEIMGDYPGRTLYLDVKIERPARKRTASAKRTAAALMAQLRPIADDNPLWLEGGSPAILRRYDKEAGGLPYRSVLSYPRFHVGINDSLEAALLGLSTKLGLSDPGRQAVRAGADSFAAPRQIISRAEAQQAADQGVPGMLFSVDTAQLVAELSAWPLQALIVDHFEGIVLPQAAC